jgi:anti-sigma factor RsiW
MIHCNLAPAEERLQQYVEGTLPEDEAQAFEEHYFDCPVCMEEVQALQAVAAELARNPVKPRAAVLRWPVLASAAALAAALAAVSLVYLAPARHPAPVAQATPPQPSPASPGQNSASTSSATTQLADLTLPAFTGSGLRGEEANQFFRAGMQAYASANCSAAVENLDRVPGQDQDSQAARFYAGACQMHLGQLSQASAAFRRLADTVNSPEQEASLYYLAQIALVQNDLPGTRSALRRVISLHGDFEQRATREIAKIDAAEKPK